MKHWRMTNPLVYQYTTSFVSEGNTTWKITKSCRHHLYPKKKFAAGQIKDFLITLCALNICGHGCIFYVQTIIHSSAVLVDHQVTAECSKVEVWDWQNH